MRISVGTAFIGRGGSGEVYCAEHVTLGTPAAVKVLVRGDERAKTRFLREAKLLAGLKSGEIDLVITAYDATGTIDIIAYDVEGSDNLSFQIISRLFKGECVAWTVKSKEQFEEKKHLYQCFIFDSYIPDNKDL